MSLSEYLAFLSFSLFMFMSPGPVAIFSVHNGLNYGVRKAVVASLGNVTALFVLLMLAALSLGMAVTASKDAMRLLQFLGAGYLVYLGLKMILAANQFAVQSDGGMHTVGLKTLYRRGFIMTATNPKAFAYLVAVIPQFVVVKNSLAPQLLIMAPTIAVAQFLSLVSYIVFAKTMRGWLLSDGRIVVVNRGAGAILITFGLVMALPSI